MIKALIAAALLLMPTSATPQGPKNIPDAVVQVLCDAGRGSAVRIGDGKYVSAAHVFNSPCRIAGQGTKVLKTEGDFVVVEGPKGGQTAAVSCKGFKTGEEYLAAGYAFGYPELTYSPMLASHFDLNDGFRTFIGEVIPGMSGGAFFDTEGRVVGIANMRWPGRSTPLKDTSICR